MSRWRRLVFVSLVPLSLTAAAWAQIGFVKDGHRIDALESVLEEDAYFGEYLTTLGDLDGDGVPELAVGAPGHFESGEVQEAGSVWILFLDAAGAVRSFTEITRDVGGFTGALPDGALFGSNLETIGDLDRDGIAELAVGSYEPNANNPVLSPVASNLWILFLDSTGHVRKHTRIRDEDPVYQPAIGTRTLLAVGGNLGDLDGDGIPELALGSTSDDDGQGQDLGAFWILSLRADGSPKAASKISQTHGGFPGGLEANDHFGASIRRLGDLDGDGNVELAVGASGSEQGRGSVWILSLLPDLSVLRARELSSEFAVRGARGLDLARLDDLDGDGLPELAVALPDYVAGNPQNDYGGILIAFLDRDGGVRKRVVISRDQGGLFPISGSTGFGRSFVPLGDLDHDGNPELAVGGQYYGPDRGTLWILSLRASAIRNGSGVNTVRLREKEEPAIGALWRGALDCRGHASGLALLAFHTAPLAGLPTPAGELLVGGQRLALLQAAHTGTPVRFDQLIPRDVALVNVAVYAQGVCSGAPGARLSNALDLLIGR